MDRTAVFIDAGYLFAAGSKLIANEKLPRGLLNLDYDGIIEWVGQLATEITGLPLLRIYWYDGTATGPTAQQLALAYRPSVKLRLGFVNQHGEQRGVDSLVVTDLINLARNRAMADALLMTGDGDIHVGVQQAQEFGIRVHLLGIAPARENQSGLLVQEADSVRELSLAEVQSFLSCVPQTAPAFQAFTSTITTLEMAAQRVASDLTSEEKDGVLAESGGGGGSVPPELDRRLLVAGSQALGGAPLTPEQKRRIRAAFLDVIRDLRDRT